MNRRGFLSIAGALAAAPMPATAALTAARADGAIKALILVDFNGGNDGLNTVIPIADERYRALRPTLHIPRDRALRLDDRTGLHPSLRPLMPAWNAGEWAIVQGVGYAQPRRSHYRSQQIWNTASDADDYRREGWLARSIASRMHTFGTAEAGPFPAGVDASQLHLPFDMRSFAASCEAAARAVHASRAQKGVTVIRLALNGFDTHEHQAARHASLLAQFADGIASLRETLTASGEWRRTLVMTRSEFGRSAHENDARGTDHGAGAPHFLLGGAVRGGLFGDAPKLDQLDADGGVPASVDFRRLCATVLDACWSVASAPVIGRSFEPLPFVRV
ncbi:DUF1501 domain-containing protein [Caballeronia sp. LZ016]|uniref:DUF1501 domain-containing protein n=1 Tax=Caballeronia sp. LZ016 TaxID=3038554 RepID=UPI0028672A5A|nr:DUF1501 domain-containing protein [Caballeronia sp. LZ016]MDR5738440.1 DUF1501 domain-containing protein [Caballeronia sp. LZ016]